MAKQLAFSEEEKRTLVEASNAITRILVDKFNDGVKNPIISFKIGIEEFGLLAVGQFEVDKQQQEPSIENQFSTKK